MRLFAALSSIAAHPFEPHEGSWWILEPAITLGVSLLTLAYLGIVLGMAFAGKISARNSLTVEMAGLYWHFVDLVWVAIFTLIYLI